MRRRDSEARASEVSEESHSERAERAIDQSNAQAARRRNKSKREQETRASENKQEQAKNFLAASESEERRAIGTCGGNTAILAAILGHR